MVVHMRHIVLVSSYALYSIYSSPGLIAQSDIRKSVSYGKRKSVVLALPVVLMA